MYKEAGFHLQATSFSLLQRLHAYNRYFQEVEHAGYRRSIISRNPPLIDADGYDIDSDDDEERIQDAIISAAEDDPYSAMHLERKW